MQKSYTLVRTVSLATLSLVLGLLPILGSLHAQLPSPFEPVLTELETLEGARDPKCHATAARLEDFMYGTPLSPEARALRIDFQEQLVSSIWLDYTSLHEQAARIVRLEEVIQMHFSYQKDEQGVVVSLPNGSIFRIPERDFRQYSSVAYALRAILSVQQACWLAEEELKPLDEAELRVFKEAIDIAVLSVLHQADQAARAAGSDRIMPAHIQVAVAAWNIKSGRSLLLGETTVEVEQLREHLFALINEKQQAYQQYNEINQVVFLRNIQVYFAKVPWPVDADASDQLKNHFTALMVEFATTLLREAQAKAQAAGTTQVNYLQMHQCVQSLLPHEINPFEDVTYFPLLPLEQQTTIQSYDLDAFRDSGLHWQYLRFALEDLGNELSHLPDPFATEMYVEGVAQFAVYLFREGGAFSQQVQADMLTPAHLNVAWYGFNERLQTYASLPPLTNEQVVIASAPSTTVTGQRFVEVTEQKGLLFEHRNSDWLSRLIRGYLIKEGDDLVRLSIPPAFGGGGVAAEDIDNDGWPDILLLGGKGNCLLRNKAGQGWEDITVAAGLLWQRPDGTFGEARQPIIADFDNDGWQDIFISYANDEHRLYRNLGDGHFADETVTAQLGGTGLVGGPATAIDFDRDGLLDLYIGYFGNYLAGDLPTLARHNTNGTPNKLFRNLGGFRFEEVLNTGTENSGWTQAVGHTDINGDGWQDLIAGNDFGVNAYYINQQDGTFLDAATELGTGKPSYTMNVGVGDLNEDLQPDFYISNIVVMEKDDKYVLPNADTRQHFDPTSLASMRVVEANDLFISDQASYQQSSLIDRGYAATGWSWDADFFDFDNDTDLDLYCLTGMNQYSVYGTENEYYESPKGESVDITFANSQAEANVLFENRDGRLQLVTDDPLAYEGTSRSAAYLDYDLDGDLDVVVNEFQGRARLFENRSEQLGYHWLGVHLKPQMSQVTADGIGTQVIVTLPNGRQLWREVHSTTGYLSGHPKTLYFGLGEVREVSIEVRWPNGKIDSFNEMPIDEVVELEGN